MRPSVRQGIAELGVLVLAIRIELAVKRDSKFLGFGGLVNWLESGGLGVLGPRGVVGFHGLSDERLDIDQSQLNLASQSQYEGDDKETAAD